MKIDLSFLDYAWRGLVIGNVLAATVLLCLFLVYWIFRGHFSQRQMKWFFNSQVILLIFVFLASFLFVALADPELAVGCFDQFVKVTSSIAITRFIAGFWILSFFCFCFGMA